MNLNLYTMVFFIYYGDYFFQYVPPLFSQVACLRVLLGAHISSDASTDRAINHNHNFVTGQKCSFTTGSRDRWNLSNINVCGVVLICICVLFWWLCKSTLLSTLTAQVHKPNKKKINQQGWSPHATDLTYFSIEWIPFTQWPQQHHLSES